MSSDNSVDRHVMISQQEPVEEDGPEEVVHDEDEVVEVRIL